MLGGFNSILNKLQEKELNIKILSNLNYLVDTNNLLKVMGDAQELYLLTYESENNLDFQFEANRSKIRTDFEIYYCFKSFNVLDLIKARDKLVNYLQGFIPQSQDDTLQEQIRGLYLNASSPFDYTDTNFAIHKFTFSNEFFSSTIINETNKNIGTLNIITSNLKVEE